MRNDLHEPGRGLFKSAGEGARLGALIPPAVDEALADDATLNETTPIVAQRGSRRELTAAADVDRRIIDHAHPSTTPDSMGAATEGDLMRKLAQQLSSLAAQQDQIRRLLEQAEQHSATNRANRI